MKEFELSTKKSLHSPITVKIDGKTYETRLLSKALFDEMRGYEKAAAKGDEKSLFKQVQLLFPIPLDVLNKLDVRDISSLLKHTTTQIISSYSTSAKEEKAGKNVLKPGEKTSD